MHPAPDPLSRKLAVVRRVLWWERLWPEIAALLSLLALLLAVALFDILPLLPPWLHGAVLAAFALLASSLLLPLRRKSPPRPHDAARRLERDNHSLHRPLDAGTDRLAAGAHDPLTQALWHHHRHHMEAEAARLRPGWPDPVLPARDPWALRFIPLLLLVIAAAGGWRDAPARLTRALTPPLEISGLGPRLLEVWITPPPYTGLGPRILHLDTRMDTPLDVAEGSRIKALIAGGWGDASLRINDRVILFQRDESGEQRVDAVLGDGSLLEVRQGWRTVASWPLRVIRDALPAIAFTGEPETDERGRVRLAAEASDDYGLTKAWVTVSRFDGAAADGDPRLDFSLAGEHPRRTTLSGRLDLADHDWAGTPVRLVPWAEDAAGQSAAGEGVVVTLPQRIFRHPVARALAEWRHQIGDAPRRAPDVAQELRLLSSDPELYGGDVRVHLTLALAQRILAAESTDVGEARALLWAAAIRIEDGSLSSAERELDEARSALEQAIAAKAPAARLAELLERFEAAMGHWLDALDEAGLAPPPQSESDTVAEEDLSALLDSLRDLAETGDREALRRRLDELTSILSRLGSTRSGHDDGLAAKTMARLRDLSHRQQDLLDQSFDQSRPRKAKPLAEAQKALRRDLERLTEEMGEPPTPLAEAGQMMAEAAETLGRSEWELAVEQQTEALSRLRDGIRALVERMDAVRAKGKGGSGLAVRDPFGRGLRNALEAQDPTVRIPGQEEIRRAREILDELRRRSGDFHRPEAELDYLRRLLKQF
ncbi:Kinesin-like protein K39 [Candidatus Terasakiella magnetica]|nr:Kinesin-like protein K39 [Candidatus Terasakiella magnetica]